MLDGITVNELEIIISQCVDACLFVYERSGKPVFDRSFFMSGDDVDQLLMITPPTRRKMVKAGHFNAYKIEGKTLYKRTEIMEAIEKGKVQHNGE